MTDSQAMSPKFKIGDDVFTASYDRIGRRVVCPDCFGSKRVKVVIGDGTEFAVECSGCYPGGIEPPTGTIKQYSFSCTFSPHTITGVTINLSSISYELDRSIGGNCYRTAEQDDLFATKEEALAAAEIKRVEHEARENEALMGKTKNHKTWAWNATYHRRGIKEAERQLAYHKSKVQICESHKKEERVNG